MRFIIFMLVMMLGGLAEAQQVVTPVMGSSASDDGAQPVASQTHILVIGDALGGGLGAGFSRLAESDGSLDITLRFNEESGIARPEVYDWGDTVPKILDGKSYDAAVVLIGSNDRQMIRDGDFRYAFGTDPWKAAYVKQLDRVLDAFKAAGIPVYWVSLPPMQDLAYDGDLKIVSALQKQEVEKRAAHYVDLRADFLGKDGAYIDSDTDSSGAPRKLRGKDGVSFFKQGNDRMAELVLAAIRSATPQALPKSGTPVTAKTSAPAAALPPVAELPVFGQAGSTGEDQSFRAEDVLVAMGPGGAGLVALRALAQPGSAAERMFVTGEAAPPPKGRADDFSLK
ncbi:DUF459 domain-containing protein [Aestuariivirga sp.]|uniref:SGNH/GDSL hydrolase family protein n=1 Tax=Aestuariivirga sp. TaxID=2650926 RepID=UPI0039E658C8